MDNTNYKLIATLALLRTLYNNDRKNIYHVIAEMARSAIVKKGLKQTSITELSRLLKKEYGVSIINPVLSYSLKMLSGIKMDQQMGLSVMPSFSSNLSEDVERAALESRQNNDLMLSELCEFIEEKKGEKLSERQREQVKADMCYYVSHDSIVDSPYKGFIGTFYMEKQKTNAQASKTFNVIHEGRILYDGLSGSADLDNVESFDRPLKVYLETEILFHATGLNGELYAHLFRQFYEQVESINMSSIKNKGQRVITLKFFSETANEIGYYFAQAEQILAKKLSPAQPGNAMDIIVSSCKSPADVKIKEHAFWKKLAGLGIQEDSSKFDVIQNGQYNLVSTEEAAKAKKRHSGELTINDEQRAYDVLQMLSKINYNRRNINARNFKTADSVLVTGRAMTHDYSQRLTPKGDVPFAVSMSYLTNRFWFSFHRGLFDSQQSITSDQLLGFAQIAVSQQINDTLREEFKSLSLEVKEGRMTKEDAVERVVALKQDLVVLPDDVPGMVEDESCYDYFDRSSIARKLEEKELMKQKQEEALANTKLDLNRQKQITQQLLALQNEREIDAFNKDLEKYNEDLSCFVSKDCKRKKMRSWMIAIGYLLLLVLAVVAAVLLSNWGKNVSLVLVVVLVAVPIVERFSFRLIKSELIIEAFRYVFNLGCVRATYEKRITDDFIERNPEPQLVLSKEEDFFSSAH